MNALLEKKKDVINVLRLRKIRYQNQKEKKRGPQKVYRLPKLINLDLIE